MNNLRSPWIPAGLITAVSVAAYIERDNLRSQDKLTYAIIMALLSVYVLEALRKAREARPANRDKKRRP